MDESPRASVEWERRLADIESTEFSPFQFNSTFIHTWRGTTTTRTCDQASCHDYDNRIEISFFSVLLSRWIQFLYIHLLYRYLPTTYFNDIKINISYIDGIVHSACRANRCASHENLKSFFFLFFFCLLCLLCWLNRNAHSSATHTHQTKRTRKIK